MPTRSIVRTVRSGASEPVAAGSGRDLDVDDDQARFLRFARLDLDRAYRLAGLILQDAHEAEDAVQDALLSAW